MVIAWGGLPASRAARFGASPGTYVDLDCLGVLTQSSTCIDKAGKMMARIEQTGE